MRSIVVILLLAIASFASAGARAAEAPAKLELAISGMHCGSCADGIEAMLKRTEGVVAAQVSYEEREATVEYDAAKTSPAKIVDAVEKLGYKAKVKR